jgi:N-acetyl-anhydromuramyl-L-alanine amidase AmpD
MRRIDTIALHVAAGNEGDVPYLGSLLAIDKFHREVREWRMVGYHFIILNGYPYNPDDYIPATDGSVEIGRPLSSQGAHVKGLNEHSVGICFIGQSGKQSITQLMVSRVLVNQLRKMFNLSPGRVFGHGELDRRKPLCPGIDMTTYRKYLTKDSFLSDLI